MFVTIRDIAPGCKPSSNGSTGLAAQGTCRSFSLLKLEDIVLHQEAIAQFEEKAMLQGAL